jgi:NAD(P)-dependent dehydrogenase (short-subunit alcohol dehydrogenase family)
MIERISFTKMRHTKPYPYISPTRPELSAGGKNVVVTGGGTGIGNAIGVAFAQADAKSVSIIGRRLDKLKSGAATISAASKETQVLYEVTDLLNLSQVDTALKGIVEKVGKIDILVSNAGYVPIPGHLVGYNAENLAHGFELNVLSAFNAFQSFIPLVGPDTVLLNTSTCLANMSPWPGVSGYAIMKAANMKMMDYFAAENPNLHVVNVQQRLGAYRVEWTSEGGARYRYVLSCHAMEVHSNC